MNARKLTNVRPYRFATCVAALASLALPAAALAAPQIEVRIDGQVVANNQEISFADTALGESSPLIVVIRNIGDQDLLFTGDPFVTLFGGFVENFSVIQPPLETGNKLSPSGSTAFRVDFTPGFTADRLDTKAFIFTNSTPTAFGITLVGRSVGPRMSVKQDGVTIADGGVVVFPDTLIGQTSTVELVIENAGNAALQLTGALPATLGGGQAGQFVITSQPTTTIAAGGSSTMRITFTPATATAATTGVFMPHNERSIFHDGLYGASLQARGLPAVDVVEEDQVIEEELNDDVVEDQEVNENDNQYDDGNDLKEDCKELNEDAELSPVGNPCGFGIGFAVPACLFGLCSVRSGVRRRAAGR